MMTSSVQNTSEGEVNDVEDSDLSTVSKMYLIHSASLVTTTLVLAGIFRVVIGIRSFLRSSSTGKDMSVSNSSFSICDLQYLLVSVLAYSYVYPLQEIVDCSSPLEYMHISIYLFADLLILRTAFRFWIMEKYSDIKSLSLIYMDLFICLLYSIIVIMEIYLSDSFYWMHNTAEIAGVHCLGMRCCGGLTRTINSLYHLICNKIKTFLIASASNIKQHMSGRDSLPVGVGVSCEQSTSSSSIVEADEHHRSLVHLRRLLDHHVWPPDCTTEHCAGNTSHLKGFLTEKRVLPDAQHVANNGIKKKWNNVRLNVKEYDSTSQSSEDNGIIFNVLSKYNVYDYDTSDTQPTAAETTLPWKRDGYSNEEEPVSSSRQHELQEDGEPIHDDILQWVPGCDDCTYERCTVGNDAHTSHCNERTQSDEFMKENGLNGEREIVEEEFRVKEWCMGGSAVISSSSMGCITNRNISVVESLCTSVECYDVLPLPWKSDMFSSFVDASGLVDRCRHLPIESETILRKCYSVPIHDVSESLLPLPWYNVSDSCAIPDDHAPRPLPPLPADTRLRVSQSPSPSCDSFHVHASCHSFLLTEAESRHSEPMVVQPHLLEYTSRMGGQGSLEDLEDVDEMDCKERVSCWLEGVELEADMENYCQDTRQGAVMLL